MLGTGMVLSVRASAPRYHKKSKVHLASLPSAERRPRRESSLPQLTSKEILWDLCWTWYEEWEVSGHMRVSNKKIAQANPCTCGVTCSAGARRLCHRRAPFLLRTRRARRARPASPGDARQRWALRCRSICMCPLAACAGGNFRAARAGAARAQVQRRKQGIVRLAWQRGRGSDCACARGPSHLHSEPGRAAAAGGGPRSLSMQRCTLWNAAVTARPELLSRPRCGST